MWEALFAFHTSGLCDEEMSGVTEACFFDLVEQRRMVSNVALLLMQPNAETLI